MSLLSKYVNDCSLRICHLVHKNSQICSCVASLSSSDKKKKKIKRGNRQKKKQKVVMLEVKFKSNINGILEEIEDLGW